MNNRIYYVDSQRSQIKVLNFDSYNGKDFQKICHKLDLNDRLVVSEWWKTKHKNLIKPYPTALEEMTIDTCYGVDVYTDYKPAYECWILHIAPSDLAKDIDDLVAKNRAKLSRWINKQQKKIVTTTNAVWDWKKYNWVEDKPEMRVPLDSSNKPLEIDSPVSLHSDEEMTIVDDRNFDDDLNSFAPGDAFWFRGRLYRVLNADVPKLYCVEQVQPGKVVSAKDSIKSAIKAICGDDIERIRRIQKTQLDLHIREHA